MYQTATQFASSSARSRAEVVRIEGQSYRAKEAQERLSARARQRSSIARAARKDKP